MTSVILSLLMALGGQTETPQHVQLNPPIELLSNSELVANVSFVECSDGMTMTVVGGIVAHCVNRRWIKEPCDDVKRPEISLHPYPLWRMEAQEPSRNLTVSAVMEPKSKRTFTSGATRDIDSGPMLNQIPTVCLVGKDKPDFCASYQPIDVPAVQEPNSNHCRPCAIEGCLSMCIMEPSFTCSDPSRSLESSVDGLKHWCHRMSD